MLSEREPKFAAIQLSLKGHMGPQSFPHIRITVACQDIHEVIQNLAEILEMNALKMSSESYLKKIVRIIQTTWCSSNYSSGKLGCFT